MIRLLLLVLLGLTTTAPAPKLPTAGTGTIYLGAYSGLIVGIDEATEKVVAQIPLKTGPPYAVRISGDRSRLYVQSADLEHFEVVDLAGRKSVDSFTLSDGHTHVRALTYEVDPQQRMLMLVAQTTTKLIDRFEIGAPEFIQFDLKEHKVLLRAPWSADTDPRYGGRLRFSPDGKLLYVFGDEIAVHDAATLAKVDSWDLALPNEPDLGQFSAGARDRGADDPDTFTGLFTTRDSIGKRRMLVIGRVNLTAKSIDYFPLGPTPAGDLSFAIARDRKRGYLLREEIGHHELWTIDMATQKVVSQVPFEGRPRLAVAVSSSGQMIYLHEAGNTIDLYSADEFKRLRTITLDTDMMYRTFMVLP
ncbi:MAG: hypothetical protein ABI665_00735 [Vicinamibacterales bacterium]